MRSPERRGYKGVCGLVVAAGLLASCTVLPMNLPHFEKESFIRSVMPSDSGAAGSRAEQGSAGFPARPASLTGVQAANAPLAPLGTFVRADPGGLMHIPELQHWLGGTEVKVGHTYLPGDRWSNIEGRPGFLEPWTRWRRAQQDRMFVLNVPMTPRNEDGLRDRQVRKLLRAGAAGRFDGHFRTLAERLVQQEAPDTVIVLGWEMNGSTYSHRCGPAPGAWKQYWRNIVAAMRSVPGQKFRFDFAPSRGRDAYPWTKCYPGDDVVDIVGMDAYDQPEGHSFESQVNEPYGLQDQVDFARRHGKAISYPEWGLFRNGDNPEYVRRMLDWFDRHKPLYQTLTDYCPHGVWQCTGNPDSAEAFRAAVFGRSGRTSAPSSGAGSSGEPGARSPAPVPSPSRTAIPVPTQPGSRIPWYEDCFAVGKYCVRFDKLMHGSWVPGAGMHK
ncbi:glycoside hydrolase family 26 protein [Streptomyces sp. WMMB 322]|uniref:glycoside hydrolase family 26 protein n=1 Tax=Streptomyces sp. WMMB 322 TaxID=1286821 RepID=UPI0006E304FE|nr:glycosyl hydrolase [Streptomyces sp. WMMB 322]SCK51431.1 Glycosyl hydrolase family 26 [Streptomyces sp. WMMB 322]